MAEDTYTKNLEAVKQQYPFDYWRAHWQQELPRQLEPNGVEDSNAVQYIFDKLIAELVRLGNATPEKKKVKLIQKAIEETNDYAHIIETGQAEELCELTNIITVACGLDPEDYGEGEGLTSGRREW